MRGVGKIFAYQTTLRLTSGSTVFCSRLPFFGSGDSFLENQPINTTKGSQQMLQSPDMFGSGGQIYQQL
jgi:hypothetical protein